MKAAKVVVFDVNETLSDMAPMARRFTDIGAPELIAKVWFASVLRDGFALAVAGSADRFATVATGALRTLLPGLPLTTDLDVAIEHVMTGFMELSVHPDVPDGVRRLRQAGLRLVTLTNGSVDVAERLLTGAEIRDQFETLLSVDDAGVWKPAPGAYAYAAQACGVDVGDMVLVAVHPWDIDGAARAGLATAWINRGDQPYPAYFTPPRHTVAALPELADKLAGCWRP